MRAKQFSGAVFSPGSMPGGVRAVLGRACRSGATWAIVLAGVLPCSGFAGGQSWMVSIEQAMARWSFRLGNAAGAHVLIKQDGLAGANETAGHDANRVEERDASVWDARALPLQRIDNMVLTRSLGVAHATDTDVYATAAQLGLGSESPWGQIVGRPLIVSASARTVLVRPMGALVWEGPERERRKLQLAGSLGVMLRDDMVVGAEYRMKPQNLGMRATEREMREQQAWDVFLTWLPGRNVGFTLAWIGQGASIARGVGPVDAEPGGSRSGIFVSGQMGF